MKMKMDCVTDTLRATPVISNFTSKRKRGHLGPIGTGGASSIAAGRGAWIMEVHWG